MLALLLSCYGLKAFLSLVCFPVVAKATPRLLFVSRSRLAALLASCLFPGRALQRSSPLVCFPLVAKATPRLLI
jgi:hypothetical protein